ncbi:MAG: aldose epimerase family protein [Roseibacillus sp.]
MLTADAPNDKDASQGTGCQVTAETFGKLKDGREARLFTLTNQNGIIAKVSEFGALLTNVFVPDREGQVKDLTHGFDDLAGWEDNDPYFGATVGRFGNRIAKGSFTLEGMKYDLATNNDPAGIPCHLHGGLEGFSHKLWKSKIIPNGVALTYLSVDGEEGYPGDLSVTVTYTLNESNELTWKAEATTTRATPINIIHHSYWNLSGDPTTPISDHLLTLNADNYLATDEGMIPTGERKPVAGTPMDFRTPTAMGLRVEEDYPSLIQGNGYDHAWVINGEGLRIAAKATDPVTGRSLELSTNQPAVQFYGANYLDGVTPGKGGVPYQRRSAFCLETETFPDGPNNPQSPNCILHPGETYLHTMVHKFSW